MVGLPFGHHSTMALCAMVVQASSTSIPVYRTPPSVPSPQDVSSPPTAVLCLGLLSRPHIPAPSPCLQWWTPSQAGWAGLGQQPLYRSHCVLLPQTVAVFSSHRERGSSSTLTELPSHPSDRLPQMSTSPLFSSPTRIGGPIPPLPFPSSFFRPTWLIRDLSCPFRCPRSSVSVQLGSVRVVPFAHVFSMHL